VALRGTLLAGGRRRLVAAALTGALVGAGIAAAVAAWLWPAAGSPASAGSVPVHAAAVRTGPFLVEARELRCGLAEIVGTHAEFYPRSGQFCRVRVRVTAEEADVDAWDSRLQELGLTPQETADTAPVSFDAMSIKRQPLGFSLGGYATLEFDLWFDVPKAATASALLLRDTAASRPTAVPLPRRTWPFGATG
jgi:hypothetical protein